MESNDFLTFHNFWCQKIKKRFELGSKTFLIKHCGFTNFIDLLKEDDVLKKIISFKYRLQIEDIF